MVSFKLQDKYYEINTSEAIYYKEREMRFKPKMRVNLLQQKRTRRQSVFNQIRWLEGKQLEAAKAGDKWRVDEDEKEIRRLKSELRG